MPERNPWFHRAFAACLFILAALELTTLLRGRSGETMSSYVRGKVQHPVLRIVTGGLLGWLTYHWLGAQTTQLGWQDAASTLGGMVVGFVASKQRLQA